ncbi:protein kinase domain-containing protein, partial [Thermococcus sp.]
MKTSVHTIAMLTILIIMVLIPFPSTIATNWVNYKNSPQHTGIANDALEPPLEPLWSFKTGGSIVSSPAVYNGTLYLGSDDYYVYALDALTGKLKWKFKTGGRVEASPVVWGDTVYVGSLDGNLYALDAKTGQLKWRFEALGSIVSSPVVEYDWVFFGSTGRFIYAINATTGEEVWEFKTEGKVEASPAVYGQLLIAGSYDGKVYALGVKSGAVVWIRDLGEPITSSAIVVDSGTVYAIAGAKYLYALDVMSGEVQWKREIALRDTGYTKPPTEVTVYKGYEGRFSPVTSGGTVYIAYYRNIYKVNAWVGKSWREDHYYLKGIDMQNAQTKWNFEVGGPIQNSPTISGSTVYFGCDDGYLYALHVDSGELEWKYFINSSIRSSPVIVNGILYIGADDGNIYAFASDDVIATYSKLVYLKEFVNRLRKKGVPLSEEIDGILFNVTYSLRIGEIDKAKSEIAEVEEIISKARYNYTSRLLGGVNETYSVLLSKGFNVSAVKTLIIQAENELHADNYDKATELINQAASELRNIKNQEAKKAQNLLGEAEFGLENISNITNTSELENRLQDAKEKIKNEEYPDAIAILKWIIQQIKMAQEANSNILSAEVTIHQKKEGGFNTTDAENLLKRAKEAFRVGEYNTAEKLAKQATELIKTEHTAEVERQSLLIIQKTKEYRFYLVMGVTLLVLLLAIKTSRRQKPISEMPSLRTQEYTYQNREAPSGLLARYEYMEYIGEGGFARVFKARRKKDGKVVAVKVPKTLDPATGKAFLREISNWLHLKHPNIVELYDANILPIPFLEMEYCEGSLARIRKPLPVDEASLIVFNVAEGLKYAHSKKIVHRDLKPSNVLLKNGLPKISDWGLSKVLEESMSATTTASFTPFYASPEQIDKKFGRTDERTDIWQLGVIFYELVTGKLPFEGSLSQVMMGILRDEPVPPGQLNPEAKVVEPIIMRMLAKRKEERYASVEELQHDLAEILNMTYSENLKKSKTLGDVRRAVYYLTELLLINLKTSNAVEAYKYASDLVFYAKGELKDEVKKLAEQIKLRIEEGLTCLLYTSDA